MKLRVRHADGQNLVALPDDAVIEQLVSHICSTVHGVDRSTLALKAGFPPRPIDLSSPGSTLASAGIKHGDQLYVQTVTAGLFATAPANFPPLPAGRPPMATVEAIKVSENAFLRLRQQPDDNSCLFSSIKVLLDRTASTQDIREIVSRRIEEDPATYTEALLGQTPAVYTQKIRQPSTWGGAIELSILSSHYRVQIWSVDVSTGRIDRFGQDDTTRTERAFVLYSGIHYDAIVISSSLEDSSVDTTVLPALPQDLVDLGVPDPISSAALQLADLLRRRHYYTDTATFALKCGTCQLPLTGEKEARFHAEKTGHGTFSEY